MIFAVSSADFVPAKYAFISSFMISLTVLSRSYCASAEFTRSQIFSISAMVIIVLATNIIMHYFRLNVNDYLIIILHVILIYV